MVPIFEVDRRCSICLFRNYIVDNVKMRGKNKINTKTTQSLLIHWRK